MDLGRLSGFASGLFGRGQPTSEPVAASSSAEPVVGGVVLPPTEASGEVNSQEPGTTVQGEPEAEATGIPPLHLVHDLQEQVRAMEELYKLAKEAKEEHIRKVTEEGERLRTNLECLQKKTETTRAQTEAAQQRYNDCDAQAKQLEGDLTTAKHKIAELEKPLQSSGTDTALLKLQGENEGLRKQNEVFGGELRPCVRCGNEYSPLGRLQGKKYKNQGLQAKFPHCVEINANPEGEGEGGEEGGNSEETKENVPAEVEAGNESEEPECRYHPSREKRYAGCRAMGCNVEAYFLCCGRCEKCSKGGCRTGVHVS
mmetsp:Transcript_15403/g.18570  ORF Transcript_15403/g.18570 Transcript_15403/m.18570 type:complete len:313 (-) Transcript_15403:237-1175(-)|eukprot:CAMPEP_0197848100 /NCGR_PEP_ID=MMETSP1438-20131217/7925_1 /TAXON_ID=1461541 /ORGANISM="Pterosperma sp., Strain CCMP1384" /LENGTH=312 /DNA_ID=CAMNT_0043460231 /DNA_START=342 /DNA_END=1280 /DNA_ORIENTATION=-